MKRLKNLPQAKIIAIPILILLVLVGVGIYFFTTRGLLDKKDLTPTPTIGLSKGQQLPEGERRAIEQRAVKVNAPTTIILVAKNYEYSSKLAKVKKGSKVKLILISAEGTHDLVLPGYDIKIPQVEKGQTAQAEFTASKAGTFEYYCSIGNHRSQGMSGKLIVE